MSVVKKTILLYLGSLFAVIGAPRISDSEFLLQYLTCFQNGSNCCNQYSQQLFGQESQSCFTKVLASNKFIIRQANFHQFRVIDKPGYYELIDVILVGNDAPAIIIKSDSVTLDLNNLSLCHKDNGISFDGIIVNSTCKNIVIANGSIDGFSGSGIKVLDGSRNVSIHNVRLNKNNIGLFMSGVHGAIIHNVESNNNITYGVAFVQVFNSHLSNISSNNNGIGVHQVPESLSGFLNSSDSAGFLLAETNRCFFEDCLSLANVSDETVYGFYLYNTSGLKFTRCSSFNNYGKNSIGISVNNGNSNSFFACQSSKNEASGQLSVGIFLSEEEKYCVIDSCKIESNIATSDSSGESYGIRIGESEIDGIIGTILKNNYLENNLGTVKQYGVKDFNSPPNTALVGNKSLFHGKTFSSSSIIDVHKMNYMLSYSADVVLSQIIREYSDFEVLLLTDHAYGNISIFKGG